MNVKNYTFNSKLSETKLLDELDFNSSFKVSIETPTGGGKSFYLLDYLKEKKIPFIFATDTLLLGQRLATRHNIPFYYADDRSHYEAQQLITIYQHIPKFVGRETTLIIDEAHSLITDYNWKKEVIEELLTTGYGYKRIILLSGTPLYSNDSFYKDMLCIKANPKKIQERKVIMVSYDELVGAIVQMTMALKKEGKTIVISLLDKSIRLPILRNELTKRGIQKIAVINSLSKKKSKYRGNGYRGRKR